MSFLTNMDIRKKTGYVVLIAILVVTVISYFPSFNAGFLKGDDVPFITENQYVKDFNLTNIAYVFTHSIEGYHPLSLFVLSLEWAIAGDSPVLFHVVNILIHLLIIVLLYKLCNKLFGSNIISLTVIAFFAVNPVFVQTVSQASEIRGLLMALFYILSLIQYLKYIETNQRSKYYFSILFFILSLLSNGRAIPLSITIILVDWYFGRKLNRSLVFEKIPFLLLSVVFGIVSIIAQNQTGYAFRMEGFFWYDYMFIAGYSYLQYIINLISSMDLTWGYPYPVKEGQLLPIIFYIQTIISIIITIPLFLKKTPRVVRFGILFYLINIVLLLRLLNPLTENIMEDHYVYLPALGLFIVISYYFNLLYEKFKTYKSVLYSLLAVLMLYYVSATYSRTFIWQDSITLYNDVLKKHPNRFVARNNRGYMYYNSGFYAKAIDDFKVAIKNKSDYADPVLGMAQTMEAMGNSEGAFQYYTRFIDMIPYAHTNKNQISLAYNNRGVFFSLKKDYSSALKDYSNAIKYSPDYIDPLINTALIYAVSGDFEKSIALCLDIETRFSGDKRIPEVRDIRAMVMEDMKKQRLPE